MRCIVLTWYRILFWVDALHDRCPFQCIARRIRHVTETQQLHWWTNLKNLWIISIARWTTACFNCRHLVSLGWNPDWSISDAACHALRLYGLVNILMPRWNCSSDCWQWVTYWRRWLQNTIPSHISAFIQLQTLNLMHDYIHIAVENITSVECICTNTWLAQRQQWCRPWYCGYRLHIVQRWKHVLVNLVHDW